MGSIIDHPAIVTPFSGPEFLSVGVSLRREDLSVYNESLLSPSAFGVSEVTYCVRHLFCMPLRFRANRDDAVDGWRGWFVDDSRDYGVTVTFILLLAKY